MCILSQD
jgi:hypothetical protein